MRLEPCRLSRNRHLSDDYLHRFERLRERFDYRPNDDDAYRRRAEWIDRTNGLRADRSRLASVLLAYNHDIHNDERALEAAERLADDRTLTVVGGQQAGLFTGPLMVIYKAVTIIRTARKVSDQLGRTVVPVFWIAGEDHDFDEVDHVYQWSSDLKVEKVRIEANHSGRRPVSDVDIEPEQWSRVLARLRERTPDTPFTARLFERLHEMAAQSRTLVDLFARLLAWLFGPHGLVLMNSGDKRLRELESPMMEWLVRQSMPLADALSAGTDSVRRLGYDIQVETDADSAHLFVLEANERMLLYRERDRFSDRSGRLSWSEDQLADLAKQAPHRLSNNVLTRPLMQEYLLPVAATVVGRSEAAYWAQLKEAFHLAERRLPPLVLREEYTLIDRTLEKHLNHFSLTVDDVLHRFEQKKAAWLSEQDDGNLDEWFAEAKRKFIAMYEPVVERVVQAHPGMSSLGKTNMKKIVEQMEFLQKKSKAALLSKHEAELRRMQLLSTVLAPMGRPQERVYNIVAYLNQYGSQWVTELLEATPEPGELHHIVRLN